MKLIFASIIIGVSIAILIEWGFDPQPWLYLHDLISQWMQTHLSP